MQAVKSVHTEKSSMRAFWVIKNPRPKKTARFRFSLFLMIVLLAAGVLIVNLSQRALITENAMRIEKLKNQLKTEKYRREKLTIETEILKSPDRIEQIAREKLGMISPNQLGFIQIPDNFQKKIAQPKNRQGLKQSMHRFINGLSRKLEDALLSDPAFEAEAGIP